jgi:hypothetical protein
MEQVEMNNIYINIGENNSSEKCTEKNTATSGSGCVYFYLPYITNLSACQPV